MKREQRMCINTVHSIKLKERVAKSIENALVTTDQTSKISVTHNWQSRREKQSHLSKPEAHTLSHWVSGAL